MPKSQFDIEHVDNYLRVMRNWRRLPFDTVPAKVFAGACDVAEGLMAEVERLRTELASPVTRPQSDGGGR